MWSQSGKMKWNKSFHHTIHQNYQKNNKLRILWCSITNRWSYLQKGTKLITIIFWKQTKLNGYLLPEFTWKVSNSLKIIPRPIALTICFEIRLHKAIIRPSTDIQITLIYPAKDLELKHSLLNMRARSISKSLWSCWKRKFCKRKQNPAIQEGWAHKQENFQELMSWPKYLKTQQKFLSKPNYRGPIQNQTMKN